LHLFTSYFLLFTLDLSLEERLHGNQEDFSSVLYQAKALRTSKRQSQSPIEGFVQFPSTFYTPDALGYMSHSLNWSHIRLAYFQPMASCLADGFLSIKINMQNKKFF